VRQQTAASRDSRDQQFCRFVFAFGKLPSLPGGAPLTGKLLPPRGLPRTSARRLLPVAAALPPPPPPLSPSTMAALATSTSALLGPFLEETAGATQPSPDTPAFLRPKPPTSRGGSGHGGGAQVARRRWTAGKNAVLGGSQTLAIRHLARRDGTGQLVSRKTVGRKNEVAELRRRVDLLAGNADGGILVFQGDAGLGKSHLCRRAIKMAGENGLTPLRAYCNAMKDATPYYPIQCMLEELFEVSFLPADDARKAVTERIIEDWPHLLDRIGLLNAVLPFHFPETMQISVLKGFPRMENTKRFLIELLQSAAEALGKLVLIFEDVHWMDSLSWSLLADISASVHPLLIVMTHRLWLEEFPPPIEYEELIAADRTEIFDLGGLTRDQTRDLSMRILRVDEMPEVVLVRARERGGGGGGIA
jgi:hypothetical protein